MGDPPDFAEIEKRFKDDPEQHPREVHDLGLVKDDAND
jgi:hypothetical protein